MNQVVCIWLGEARAHLHAAVAALDDPARRRRHGAAAWNYAMRVLILEDSDAQASELDYAALFVEEAFGHIAAAAEMSRAESAPADHADRDDGTETAGNQ